MEKLTKYERPALLPISNLRKEMDRIFNELIPFSWRLDDEWESDIRTWSPKLDMEEIDEQYNIEVELPGMSKKDIKINLQDNVLTIEGEREKKVKKESNGYLRSERSFGQFKRSLVLPVAVVEDKIKATFKDGILTVSVPKAEKSKRKAVPIE